MIVFIFAMVLRAKALYAPPQADLVHSKSACCILKSFTSICSFEKNNLSF
nr:MAG TPA: hypothetical protein [Caudoviricetes sp.]